MKDNDDSTPLCRLPHAAVERLARFLDPQIFWNCRIGFEDKDASVDFQTVQLDLDDHSYLLHQEDYDTLCQMRRRIRDFMKNRPGIENAPAAEKERRCIDLIGYSVTAKIITLVQALLICHNYYNAPTERYPGFKPSSLLDPLLNTDFATALRYEKAVLIDEPGKHADLKAARMSDIYAMMKTLFDLTAGWLPCEEGDDLRNAYAVFHTTADGGEALNRVVACLQALSARFANEEPKWERARAELANGVRQPLIPNVRIPKEVGKKLGMKNKRRGSGLKGPKKALMAKQLADFEEWINNGHEIDERYPGKTVGARAKQYWNQNKKSMEKAVKASGEKHGYNSPKGLADAYRKR